MNKNHFKFLLPAISDNDSRKNLTAVFFSAQARKLTITAANAFIIKRISIDTDLPDGEYFLDRATVRIIIKLAKKDDITLSIAGVNVEGILVEWTIFDFQYPNLDRLINGEFGKQKENIVGIFCSNMESVLKNAPNECCKIDFGSTLRTSHSCEAPIRFTWISDLEYKAILMPARIQW